MPTSQFVINPAARSKPSHPGLFRPEEYDQVASFFCAQRQLSPTPLLRLPALSSELNVRELLLKDESERLGLKAFKILGVSYAVARLLSDGRLTKNSVLVCASTGNHGRALAYVARKHGFAAKIYVPVGTPRARVDVIAREGAEVVVVDGKYDDAVEQAKQDAERKGWTLVAGTSWPGYEEIPRWIMAGYTRLIEEAANQWSPESPPDLVLVQAGTGEMACAVASWLSYRYGVRRPFVIACEPTAAACLLESAREGGPVVLRGPLDTIMSGLRCAEVSHIAWPVIAGTIDAFVSIADERSLSAMRILAHPRGHDPIVVAGESGACGLAALLSILEDKELCPVREASRLGPDSRVLVINTEGAIDPEGYKRIVGQGDDR